MDAWGGARLQPDRGDRCDSGLREVEVSMEVAKEAMGREPLFPKTSAVVLKVDVLTIGQPLVKCGDSVSYVRHFLPRNPDNVVTPIDEKLVREHRVRVQEHGDSTEAQGFVETK